MEDIQRQSYLDWLRIAAILGVLFFHCAMPFAAEESWHIRNTQESYLLLEFNFWLSRFRMPLLFFISGAVCFYMLKKKTTWQFIGLRFRRLMVPLLVGMLIIVPPQIYMERLTQGEHYSSFFDFYLTVFQFIPYPKGNLSWHHLWFILYLFLYDLIAAPIFIWMLSAKGRKIMARLNFLSGGSWIYLLVAPAIIQYTSMVLHFRQTNDLIHDWAMIPYWFWFVFIGFIIVSQQGYLESLVRNRKASLLLAFVSIIVMNYIRWNGLEPWDQNNPGWRSEFYTYFYLALFPVAAWSWVLALVGYGKKYLNRYHKIHQYCNPAVYPFYILHQTIIVILAYYVVQVEESILSKYIFLVAVTFGLSIFIFHLLIRPYNFMRFIFGMKPRGTIPSKEVRVSEIVTQPSPLVTFHDEKSVNL